MATTRCVSENVYRNTDMVDELVRRAHGYAPGVDGLGQAPVHAVQAPRLWALAYKWGGEVVEGN